MTYQLIETKTLGTAAASIEFTSIPQDGTDLLVLSSLRNTTSGQTNGNLTFNGSTSGYSERMVYGTGTAGISVSTSGSLINWSEVHPDSTMTANTFGNGRIYIANYTSSAAKSLMSEAVLETNATGTLMYVNSAIWNNTAAIASLRIAASGGTLAVGSTISLYKITRGTLNGVVVS